MTGVVAQCGKIQEDEEPEDALSTFLYMGLNHKAYLWTVLSCLEQGLFLTVPNVFLTTSVVGNELLILSVRVWFFKVPQATSPIFF